MTMSNSKKKKNLQIITDIKYTGAVIAELLPVANSPLHRILPSLSLFSQTNENQQKKNSSLLRSEKIHPTIETEKRKNVIKPNQACAHGGAIPTSKIKRPRAW